uniref:heat shock factor protein 5 isoform X2 n=1 Tax=Scatophagus argus TaxID=75038 RepID=UPI001ED7E12A|nr:heat shock factor protein 5 isoform X2 [Scatophagus argus]
MDVGESPLPDTVNPNNFPAKLWRLVNNPANKAIFWDTHGDTIIIDRRLFEQQVLSPGTVPSDNADAFKTTNFSSFVRQLNLYGFKKAESSNRDKHHCSRDTGAYHYFYNPNFKRNHPELVASLRRLTVDNKAKMQAGLIVKCRPPPPYQRVIGDGKDKNVRRVSVGSSSLLIPTHQESTHLYYSDKAQAMTAHSGTPVPPRYLIRGHGAALSPTVFADKGIPLSLSHHYAGGTLGHANHGTPNFLTFSPPNAQYQPYFCSQFCQGYQPNLLASHLTGGGLQTGLLSPHSYYQIADEMMQTPPDSCVVRVVTPEKPDLVSVHSSKTNPASPLQANLLCAAPVIMTESGNANVATCKEQEEAVLSVPEQVPEDAIFEVTIDDAEDSQVIGVEVSNTLRVTSQAFSSCSSTGSTPDL